MWLLSQVLGGAALVCAVAAFLCKNKCKTLVLYALSNFSLAVSSACLQNWVLTGTLILATLRNFCLAWLEKKILQRTHFISLSILFCFWIAAVVIVTLTHKCFYDWILLVSVIFVIYGNWAKGIHLIRISTIINSALAIGSHIFFGNYLGIAVDAAAIISICTFYTKSMIYHKRRTRNMKNDITLEIITTAGSDYRKELELRNEVFKSSADFFDDLNEVNDYHIVAKRQGIVVGCLVLTPKGEGILKMRGVAVNPSMQRHGIGKMMVAFAESFAKTKACKKIILSARLTAVPFYEKSNYECVGEQYPEFGSPHIKMEKNLPPNDTTFT